MKRPGLLGRSILTSVMVAVVSIVATAAVTLSTTQNSLDRQRTSIEKADRDTVDRLLEFGWTDHDWGDARALVHRLATHGRDVVVTDLDRSPLASSTSDAGGLSNPSAVLDPMARLVDPVAGQVPRGSRTPSLPTPLLDGRPGGRALRTALSRPGLAETCLHHAADADYLPSDLPKPDVILSGCARPDRLPGAHATDALVRLNNAVAGAEWQCLGRRGVTSLLVALIPSGGRQEAVRTVSVPDAAAGRDSADVTAAWRDCATSSLTDLLSSSVAPKALLFTTQATTTRRGLLDRIGRLRLAAALALVLLVVMGAGYVGSRRMLRPLRGLTAATRRMAGGDLSTRVDARGSDEVAGLGRSFNEMAVALSDAEEQRKRMVADVAHELRTPLANLRGYLEAGHEDVLPRDRAWTASLLEETALLQHVVDDLQVLAEADAGRLNVRPDTDDVAGTVDLAIQSIRAQADARDVRLVRAGSATATAPHDRLRMRQVVANLLSNAVRYAPEGSSIEVTVGDADDEARCVRVAVRDHGPGIAAEHLPHVFERFYRADPSRARRTGGSGLGLAIVGRIVQAHGGTVSAANAPDGGLEVIVSLPTSPTGSSAAP